MNIWITGAGGQLGRELQRRLRRRKGVFATDLELDICDCAAVESFIKEHGIEVIVNCAAYTNVEAAEQDRELCYKINETGVKILAQAARKADAALVHISTDFVFDGSKGAPYSESDSPAPLSAYGASKLAGENALFTWREFGKNADHRVFTPAGLDLDHRIPILRIPENRAGNRAFELVHPIPP